MIDKLFLSRLYYSTKNGKASSQFNEGSHEFYANRLLNNYIALLKDSASQDKENKNRTAHSNHASIDGDTKQIKDIVKDLEESKAKEKLEPFTPYSLWANASTKTEFITGKFGIGPFALNNNSQILTMLYGVRFTSDGFLGELGMNRLDLAQDRYGGSILSWISGLINAHVDVAKDPYISRLNVNSYTYNIVNLMIRTGFGKDTFYFTTQHIMKMMATAYNNAASQFGSELSRSKARRQRDAVDKAVFDYLKSNFVLPSDVTSLKQAEKIMDGYFKKTRGIEVLTAIKELLAKDNDILHQIAKQGEVVNDAHERWNVGGVMMSTKEVQYLVYRAKQEFQPYERDLADLVKYSKIDTSKQGKNIVEQQAYKDGVKNLFENQRGAGLFEGSGIGEYYAKSYIQKKTANALDLFKDIMASFTIESTGQFRAQMNLIMYMLGETNPTADMYKAVSRQIMNYIRAGFFNKWAEENGIDVKGLVTGSNTIADRLDAIRLAIMTDPAYADMRAGDGSIKNYLLSALVHGFSWRENIADTNFNVGTQKSTHDNVKFIKTLNFMDEDQINDDDMAEAWDELLNDNTHEDIQKFARDLIMYAFITSGGNTGANLFKYIPNSWKLDSYQDGHAENGFAQYMQDQLEMYQNESDQMISIDPEEIILNNWHDNKFIPVVDVTEGYNKYYSGRHWADTTSRPEVAIPVILVKQDTDKATDDRYIKVRRTGANPHSSRNYTIYKAVAYTTSDKLIYVMVDPKGNSFPGNTLYEMRRNDSVERESSSIAKRGKKGFADFIRAASGTVDIENVSIADVIDNFINTVRAKDDIGKRAALLEMFVQDKELRDILEDAVNTTVASVGEVEEIDMLDEHPTSAFGVQIDPDLIHTYKDWLNQNPSGIVAYRTNKNGFNTAERVQEGIIGNPFDWQKYGPRKAATMFMDWLTTGDQQGEPLANEEFRRAIIDKILTSAPDTPILYYKDLGYMSHATIIGYLINNKELLSNANPAPSKEEAENTGARTYRPVNRPQYRYGRKYLTENDRKYITETVSMTYSDSVSDNGSYTVSTKNMKEFREVFDELYDTNTTGLSDEQFLDQVYVHITNSEDEGDITIKLAYSYEDNRQLELFRLKSVDEFTKMIKNNPESYIEYLSGLRKTLNC